MAARTLLDQEVHVHYGQIYVESGEEYEHDLHAAFTGQTNGLCGAAEAGSLFLITGLHTGNVGFTVERHDRPPPLDDTWDEIVEASFTPTEIPVALVQWEGEASWQLDLDTVDHRVRYCAAGMDAAREKDTRLSTEPMLDRYLLQLWPAAPEPDRVVKQTGAIAAYWHDVATRLSTTEG